MAIVNLGFCNPFPSLFTISHTCSYTRGHNRLKGRPNQNCNKDVAICTCTSKCAEFVKEEKKRVMSRDITLHWGL